MPIDIASGNVSTEFVDLVVPGKVPLLWSRRYSGVSVQQLPGALGRGWTYRYATTLTRFPGGFQFVTPAGTVELLADPDALVEGGGRVRHLSAFFEIFMREGRYVVQTWNVETGEAWRYLFTPGQLRMPLRLASLEDLRGHGLDLVWDETGHLRSVRQRLEQRQLDLSYNAAGLVDGLTLLSPSGERRVVVSYEYDTAARLVAVYDAAGFADRFEYDEKHRLAREVFKDSGVFRYRYDYWGRCVLRSGQNHYDEKRLRYLDAARITEVTDSYGATSRFQALPSGQISTEWGPLGEIRRTEYDGFGRVTLRSNAVGATTQYAYDEFGNRTRIVNPLGQVYDLVINEQHQITALKDPSGQQWTWRYDERHRLVQSIDPLNGAWLYEYDDLGNLVQVSNPEGQRRQFSYVGGVQTSQTDWAQQVTYLEHDWYGRLTGRTDPLRHVTRYTYDLVGNLIDVERPNGSHMRAAYDVAGNVIRFTNEAERTWTYEYGSCQRMLRTTDPNGNAMSFEWGSEADRLIAARNEKGETYRFIYDLNGQCTEEIGFDGRHVRYFYDAAGWCIKTVNGMNEAVTISRDPMGRIVGELLPDGQTLTFIYDTLGNIVESASPDCTVRFERDVLGRLVREIQHTAVGEHWVAYTLNGVGEVTSTQTDLGLRLDYQLDANSLWAGVRINQELEFEFQRDACGNEIGRSVPGGIQLEQRYDEMSRLVEQRVLRLRGDQQGWFPASARTGDVLLDRSYLRDPSGLIWKVNDEFAGTEYDYDPAERLLGALRRGGVTERFHYDACGNIAVLADEGLRGVAETLDYGPGNRLLRKGDTYYEHDSEGRLVRKTEAAGTPEPRVWTYVWDAFNQLVGVTRPDGTKWSYAYDAFGRRMRKIGPEGSISFVYSGRVPIHEEEVSDRRWVTWIFGPGQFTPLAKLEGKTLFAVFTDHIGTPIELVDTGNHIVHHCQFSAYGKTLTAPGMPFRFQGQYFDDESGLHYNMFRYYDPEVGRFISPDPTRLRGGYNLYQYAPNPVAWIDPWGLCRRGNQATRDHMDDTRDQFLKENPGFELVAGGRDPKTGLDLPEQYLPPLTPGTGTKGSSFVDMRFENPTTGQTVHVQTVDPQASGPSGMSQREWDNANRISQQQPSVPVVTVNKGATPPPGSLDASAMSAGPGVVNVR